MGSTISIFNKVLLSESDGKYYRWARSLPKASSTASTHESTGGVKDTTLRGELIRPGGAAIPALNQGGNVQEAIGYVTLETMGYIRGVSHSASDALDKFIEKAKAGKCSTLVLESNYDYPLDRNHVLDFPHSIIARGANFSQDSQIGTSRFVDIRRAKADGYLITIADGEDRKTYGWTWFGVEIAGTRSNNNHGLMISAEGWAFNQTRIFIRNFGKTGLALNAVLDGVMSDIFIGACGGYVDGAVYYGVDMWPEGAVYPCNLIGFYRLHIEHCRYMINLAGFDISFTDSHLEIGTPEYFDENTPCINVRHLRRPITFQGGSLTAPGWENLANALSSTDYAENIANIPAFMGTTHTAPEIIGGGEYDSKLELNGVKFASAGSYALYIDLPFIPIDIDRCHLMNAGMVNHRSPIIVGARSKISLNKIFCKTVTGYKGDYAPYVNKVTAPAIQISSGWGTIIGNDILLFGASQNSLAAVVVANTAGSIVNANRISGYTQEMNGVVAGSQLYQGMRVTDLATTMDVFPNSFVSSGSSISFKLPNSYTNSHPVYGSDSTSFNFSPNVDTGNAYLGLLTARWSEIRSKTTTIATSDGRLKTDIRELSEAEKQVAKELKLLLRAFMFNTDAYMPLSDEGKIHFGIVAQEAVAAFEKNGLNADNYAMIVHDRWDEVPAVYDNEGNEISPRVEAGDRYGIRYEELLSFIVTSL